MNRLFTLLLDLYHPVPGDIFGYIVGGPAGQGTIPAANTGVQIYHHAPTMGAFPFGTFVVRIQLHFGAYRGRSDASHRKKYEFPAV
jgi:hypothetical protein